MENMLEEDVATNKSIGKYGAENILNKRKESTDKAVILTHCNTVSFHFYFQKLKK
jgi:methylthioribose-1-phosphate isomerase